MPAAIYTRISEDREDLRLGVRRQAADLRAEAARRGDAIVADLEDNDVSGSGKRVRPGFENLVRLIRLHEVDVVFFTDLDRQSRGWRPFVHFYDACDEAGVTVVWIGGQADFKTGKGVFELELRSAFAREELRKLRERVTRKHLELAQAGKSKGGPRPYGFKRDQVTVDEREANVIREAARRLLDGESLRGVTLALNRAGHRGASGKPFQPNRLTRILLSPRIIGLREHNGARYPASWPAIIPEADQDELRAILRDPARSTPGRPPVHLLASMLLCGHCGARMKWSGSSKQNPASYACAPPPRGCGRVSIRAEDTERKIVHWVIERNYTGSRVWGSAEVDGARMPDPAADRLRLAEIADAYARGDVTIEQVTRATAAIRTRITDAEARAAAAANDRLAAARGRRLRDVWGDLGVDERRTALRSLVKSITVLPSETRGPGHDVGPRLVVEWPDVPDEDAVA